MNDTTIIKTISNIHSIIVDLLIFIFITLFTFYFTLHIGLKLDTFILPNLKIEKLYIKWDEKIRVDIDSIKITKSNTESNFDISSLDIKKILHKTRLLATLFGDINIKHIQFNDTNATFRYKEGDAGFINIQHPDLSLDAAIEMNHHLILLDIDTFYEKSSNSTIRGQLFLDTQEERLYSNLDINISDTISLDLFLLAGKEELKLWSKSTKAITKPIGPVVKLAKLGPAVDPWIIEQLQGRALNIDYLKGRMQYDKPISLFDSLEFKAHYKDVKYVFAPGYAPAISKRVDLAFKNRIFYIYPRNATYYGQPGGKTWITIDFKRPENPLISVDVDTTARLTPELVSWLDGYNIALPFYQTSGKTKVKLFLTIEIATLDISAHGNLSSPQASFNFSDTDIDVKEVMVRLDNTHVTIKSLNASLLDKAINTNVTGKFDPVSEKGYFDITLNSLHFGGPKKGLRLDANNSPLKLRYILQPNADRILIPKSYWKYNDQAISVDATTAPFHFNTLSGSLPITYLTLDNSLQAYVNGKFDIKNLTTDLFIDLIKFKYSNLSLDQTSASLKMTYNKILSIYLLKPSNWKLEKNTFRLFPSLFTYNSNLITINNTRIVVPELLDSKIEGYYNIEHGNGKVVLKELKTVLDDKELLNIHKDVKIYIKQKELQKFIEVPLFNFKMKSNAEGWEMGIKDISHLAQYSPFLQEYNLTSGAIHLSKRSSDKINIYGLFPYPYKIIVQNNEPQSKVKFSGTYKKERLNLYINNKINLRYQYNKLNITAKKIGINIFAIFDFLHDHERKTDSNDTSNLKVSITAQNSYLYFDKKRHAPADRLLLQYSDNDLKAQLLHGKDGGAALELNEKGEIYIYGDHLDDQFMTQLAEFSEFKGGEVSFYISGSRDKLNGVVRMRNTIIKDYKAINNILAFINTIPALVTFNIPHYNTKGMKVEDAYTGFSYQNNRININGFIIETPELTFNGKGHVDIADEQLDIETSLVTEATSNLSKIPLLGYILVGKDENTITTTMTLKGPMNNPVVENTMAKDMGIGSFNILKRALTFPIHYVEKTQLAIEKAVEDRKRREAEQKKQK